VLTNTCFVILVFLILFIFNPRPLVFLSRIPSFGHRLFLLSQPIAARANTGEAIEGGEAYLPSSPLPAHYTPTAARSTASASHSAENVPSDVGSSASSSASNSPVPPVQHQVNIRMALCVPLLRSTSISWKPELLIMFQCEGNHEHV
jgi:hypothetical protein